ncbi:hypothetical protein GCM10027075_39290 [Streptomyces heilongjiangensis]
MARWLPHGLHRHETDGAGPVRLIASALGELENLLGGEFQDRPAADPEAPVGWEEPFTVIVVDGCPVPAGHRFDGLRYRNAVVIDLGGSLG